MNGSKEVSKRDKKYKVPNATELLGNRLKSRRSELKYSLVDIGELTGFSTATIVDIEKGITVDINYYIAYAQVLFFSLPLLFDINIPYGPRYNLSARKGSRIYLTENVRRLYTEYNFFSEKQSVGSVAIKLRDLQIIDQVTSIYSTRISSILSTMVENKVLFVVEKKGRNKIYLKAI